MADTNVIETHEDQAPESQEHIQEMIDKAERVQSVPRNDGQPTWLPEKFESPEDLAEAYSQLEQKLSSRDTHQTENVEVKEPSSSPQNASINEVSEALGKQGIDFNKYAYEYAQNGTISDQSYGELEQQGLSQDVVDTWIAGQQAIADQTVAQAHEAVGGLDEYNSLLEWAGNALPEKEIDAFNRAIENPNVDDVVFTRESRIISHYFSVEKSMYQAISEEM